MVYLCGKKEKKVNGGVHAYFLSVCPACCACALRANVTTCREDRHPPGLKVTMRAYSNVHVIKYVQGICFS